MVLSQAHLSSGSEDSTHAHNKGNQRQEGPLEVVQMGDRGGGRREVFESLGFACGCRPGTGKEFFCTKSDLNGNDTNITSTYNNPVACSFSLQFKNRKTIPNVHSVGTFNDVFVTNDLRGAPL